MSDSPRKKSPRAPSLALSEAIEGALKIYEKERRHAVPVEVVAQHLGYKNANNGAAMKAMASIRYFGLLERPQDGRLAVAKDVEDYRFAPSDQLRGELLRRWLKTPPIFAELLEKFSDGLPSDGNLRFELIQRGFFPDAAESLLPVLKNSVEFARYYEQPRAPTSAAETLTEEKANPLSDAQSDLKPRSSEMAIEDADRIPVRLAGGRRAWLEIPTPFYEADKLRLKKQIDLLLTEEDESTVLGTSDP